MSTRSELYHCFGLGVVEILKVDHSGKTLLRQSGLGRRRG